MADLFSFFDENGEERRCGSLENPQGMVSAFPDYSTVVNPWSDDQIRKAITKPNRVPSSVRFDAKWTQNQKSHGSCNGYTVAQLIAKTRWLSGLQQGGMLLLSGAYAYSKMNGHQDAGSNLERGMHVACEEGCPPESLVPWDQIYPELQPKIADAEAKKNLGFNPVRCADMQQLRTALAQQRPCGVVVHAGKQYQTCNKKGICGVDNGSGNHAICADDLVLIDGKEYAAGHNQWGNQYGSLGNGRSYMPLEIFHQTMKNHFHYTIMNVVIE